MHPGSSLGNGSSQNSNIADADLREEPARLIATFLSRALFAQAREMKLDLMGVAKEVVAVSYADLRQSRFMSTRP
jgi:hypothetical protein